ncbi:MAG: SEC-C metal-binding domain-containing protein [Rhodoplanes sp.]
MAKPGRNDPCPCGSGKKYKKCCLTNDEAAENERLVAERAERASAL